MVWIDFMARRTDGDVNIFDNVSRWCNRMIIKDFNLGIYQEISELTEYTEHHYANHNVLQFYRYKLQSTLE